MWKAKFHSSGATYDSKLHKKEMRYDASGILTSIGTKSDVKKLHVSPKSRSVYYIYSSIFIYNSKQGTYIEKSIQLKEIKLVTSCHPYSIMHECSSSVEMQPCMPHCLHPITLWSRKWSRVTFVVLNNPHQPPMENGFFYAAIMI